MIAKKDLIVGSYYVGRCRNAYVARWSGDNFVYIRSKFGDLFLETIRHPEDDDGYDLFVPMRIVKDLSNKECLDAAEVVIAIDKKTGRYPKIWTGTLGSKKDKK